MTNDADGGHQDVAADPVANSNPADTSEARSAGLVDAAQGEIETGTENESGPAAGSAGLESGGSEAGAAENNAERSDAEPEAPARRRDPFADLDVNLMAAMFAAGGSFGTRLEGELALNVDWLQISVADCEMALKVAAQFIRANPDATPESIGIQLRLKGIRGLPAVVGLVALAWQVFIFTLNALDAHDRAERDATAAAEKAAAAAAAPGPRGARPGQLKAKMTNRSMLQPSATARALGRKKPGGA